MRSSNTFGLHFVLRPTQKGNHAIYVRIVVNRTRCELALKMTVNRLVALHNEMMGKTLEPGTMKNYKSTAIYLRNYMNLKYDAGDIYLKDLNYQFITGFEWYIRNNPIKESDPCTNNGTMKHLERLKKMDNWAYTNEWIDKDEQARIEGWELENPMSRRVRDLFIFSCYNGLAYIDLAMLKPTNIIARTDCMQWIKTARKKTEIPFNVPLLRVPPPKQIGSFELICFVLFY